MESFHDAMTGDIGYKLHRPILRLVSNLNSLSCKIIHIVQDQVNLSVKGTQSVSEAINISKEIQKIKVLSLFPSLFAGFSIYEAVKKFQSAAKVREYMEAFGHSLGVAKELINIPKDVVGICSLFDNSIAQAAQLSSWGPGISIASLLLSIASIGLKANDLRKGALFTQRMERKSSSFVIKQFVMGLQALPPSAQELLQKPNFQKELAQACQAVRDADTMLLLKVLHQELKKEQFSSELLLKMLEEARDSATYNAEVISALEKLFPKGEKDINIDCPTIKKNLADEIDKQIGRLRKLRDSVPLIIITENLKKQLREIDPSLLPVLDDAADTGYLNAVTSTREKVLKRHYGVSGDEIKACINRIERVYHSIEKEKPAEARALKQRSVRLLKEQHEKKMLSDKLAISSNVISFIASLILVVLSFGLTCTPLAIISILLSTIVISLTFAKIAYDYVENQRFEDSFGITETKMCQDWEDRLQKVEEGLAGDETNDYRNSIQALRAALDQGIFDNTVHIDFEQEIDEKRKKALIEFNKIAAEMNKWHKKKSAEPGKYLCLPTVQ